MVGVRRLFVWMWTSGIMLVLLAIDTEAVVIASFAVLGISLIAAYTVRPPTAGPERTSDER